MVGPEALCKWTRTDKCLCSEAMLYFCCCSAVRSQKTHRQRGSRAVRLSLPEPKAAGSRFSAAPVPGSRTVGLRANFRPGPVVGRAGSSSCNRIEGISNFGFGAGFGEVFVSGGRFSGIEVSSFVEALAKSAEGSRVSGRADAWGSIFAGIEIGVSAFVSIAFFTLSLSDLADRGEDP